MPAPTSGQPLLAEPAQRGGCGWVNRCSTSRGTDGIDTEVEV